MQRNFIDITKINSLDKINPPKYLEDINNFVSVLKDLKSSPEKIKEVLVKLNDLALDVQGEINDIEIRVSQQQRFLLKKTNDSIEEINSLISSIELQLQELYEEELLALLEDDDEFYLETLTAIEIGERQKELLLEKIKKIKSYQLKVKSLTPKKGNLETKLKTILSYIEKFEQRLKYIAAPSKEKQEVEIYQLPVKRRKLFTSYNDQKAGLDNGDVIQTTTEFKFTKGPTLNRAVMEEVKNVIPNLTKERRVPRGKGRENLTYKKRIFLWVRLQEDNDRNINSTTLRDIFDREKASRLAWHKHEWKQANENLPVPVKWTHLSSAQKKELYRRWEADAIRYAMKKVEDKKSGKEYAPDRNNEGLTCISIRAGNYKADDLMTMMDSAFEKLINNYGLQRSAIRLDKVSYSEHITVRTNRNSTRDWLDIETGEILEQETNHKISKIKPKKPKKKV